MKYDELVNLANDVAIDALRDNSEKIKEQMTESLRDSSENGKISIQEAVAAMYTEALMSSVQLSAVVTVRLLSRLGLIDLDQAEP